jgi:predicted helicase
MPQSGSQCFPLYIIEEDGGWRDNVTDWALAKFRSHYGDLSITKWSIFHYVYAVLHHSVYRSRYETNLKRELPRIPLVRDFWSFARAGERLAELHIGYENQPEWSLRRQEKPDVPLDWCVEKMKLSRDKRAVIYNDFLTLIGIPEKALEYRLGNRSALEWVIDQYQVCTDKRSDITNDPNRLDDPGYIVRLVGQVVHVSVETMKIVDALPAIDIGSPVDGPRVAPARPRKPQKELAKTQVEQPTGVKLKRGGGKSAR